MKYEYGYVLDQPLQCGILIKKLSRPQPSVPTQENILCIPSLLNPITTSGQKTKELVER
jgi:hypothetical protein